MSRRYIQCERSPRLLRALARMVAADREVEGRTADSSVGVVLALDLVEVPDDHAQALVEALRGLAALRRDVVLALAVEGADASAVAGQVERYVERARGVVLFAHLVVATSGTKETCS